MASDLDLEDDAPPAAGHNSGDAHYDAVSAELTQFLERIEQLELEKKETADNIKEVYSEAKGRGYDTKVIRKIIAMRKRDKNDVIEENAILAIYLPAVGMEDLL